MGLAWTGSTFRRRACSWEHTTEPGGKSVPVPNFPGEDSYGALAKAGGKQAVL